MGKVGEFNEIHLAPSRSTISLSIPSYLLSLFISSLLPDERLFGINHRQRIYPNREYDS